MRSGEKSPKETGSADGSGGGTVAAPPAQLAMFPSQTGRTQPGAAGMAWYTHEIRKVGQQIVWSIAGTDLIAVDASKFVAIQPGGDNIFFGHSDVNAASPLSPNAEALQFTLVDNVLVTTIPEPCANVLAILAAAGAVGRRRRS